MLLRNDDISMLDQAKSRNAPTTNLAKLVLRREWIPTPSLAEEGKRKVAKYETLKEQVRFDFKMNQNKQNPACDVVKIYIGTKVLEELDWKPGDTIAILHNPDDLFEMQLVKSPNAKKMIVGAGASSYSYISFKWPTHITPIQPTAKAKIIKYMFSHDSLVFELR